MSAMQKKTPCLEEFVAAGYAASGYEKHFADLRSRGEDWSPTWSDPNWRPSAFPSDLPPVLEVRSQVRKVSSRLLRKQQPSAHKFKHYLFSDPSRRLLRTRGVRITSDELARNFEELLAKETIGILAVHTLDGRRLTLADLKNGVLALPTAVRTCTTPNPALDSIANDAPSGIPLSQYIDGTFDGDPAAARVLAELSEQKKQEGIRNGSIKETTEDSIAAEDPLLVEDIHNAEEMGEGQLENSGELAEKHSEDSSAPTSPQVSRHPDKKSKLGKKQR